MKKSIRQLADELGISRTTVSNKIKALESELGQSIGEKQGKGKALLLNESEQALIAEHLLSTTTKSNSVVNAEVVENNSTDLTVVTALNKIEAQALPKIATIIIHQVDITALEQRNEQLYNLSGQLDGAIKSTTLAAVRADADLLGVEVEGIYADALVRAKARAVEKIGKK